ncbi:unnamed protein product [Echinostoma caproni]|uniref:SBF2 domain-containing protein n=1 Tax=Echinostoma caproni TaxID=27848 RepID=A0A183A9V5_9TREM|nr:unnamed protein product [Echinostoma caproni]
MLPDVEYSSPQSLAGVCWSHDFVNMFISPVKLDQATGTSQYQKSEPRFVPQGHILDRQLFKALMFPDKNRVLREFIADIFNQHITEALKRRNTIRQDLKSRPIRRLFVDELQRYLIPVPNLSPTEAINELANSTDRCLHEQRALLTWEQFELIVDLLDEALCQESQSEDTGIAPIVMELSTKFCTQLNNVRYYANMTHQIQRHHVWEQMSFWESVFNEHVNNQIRQLYLHFSEQEQQLNYQSHTDEPNRSGSPTSPTENGLSDGSISSDQPKGERIIRVGLRRKSQPSYTTNMSALEIAAEEIRLVNSRPADVQKTLEVQEESTVYAQIIHFINLIVNFRIPVDVGATAAGVYGDPGLLNSLTSGVDSNHVDYTVGLHDAGLGPAHRMHQKENGILLHAGGDRSTGESTWRPRRNDTGERFPNDFAVPSSRHPSPGDLRRDPLRSRHDRGMNVGSALDYISALEAWIRRFVEKVTDENALISHRTSKIYEKIEGVIEGHLLNLETIYPEVKNIPKTKKPEIANPTLLASEVAIPIGGYDCVRCQLLVDGRLERTDCQLLDALGDLNATGTGGPNGPDKSGPGSPVENDFEVDAMLRPLLPAQGALFVTNYRIIFTGVPKDPYRKLLPVWYEYTVYKYTSNDGQIKQFKFRMIFQSRRIVATPGY